MPSIPLPFILLLACFYSCKGQQPESSPILGKRVSAITTNPLVIYQDSKLNYWFGGGKDGVYKLTKAEDHDKEDELILYDQEAGLCSNSVIGIQEDQYGNIYFDTTEGVCKFDGTQFSELEVSETAHKSDLWALNPTDLWFRLGWESNSPYRYDGENLYALQFPMTSEAQLFYEKYPDASWSPFGIYSMFKDSRGRMWFGTSASGICIYDGQSFKWLYEEHLTKTPEGGDFGIRSIQEDDEGNFWFCNPMYRYNILEGFHNEKGSPYINYKVEEGVTVKNEDGTFIIPYFMSIVKGNNGALWMATYDQGVYKLNGKVLEHYPVKKYKKNLSVFSIYEDHNGTIWLTTHDGGLMIFTGNEFIPLYSQY